jgi:hypothetical protein
MDDIQVAVRCTVIVIPAAMVVGGCWWPCILVALVPLISLLILSEYHGAKPRE